MLYSSRSTGSLDSFSFSRDHMVWSSFYHMADSIKRGTPYYMSGDYREQILYKCDPKKNTGCSKTSCQTLCKYTTHEEYRANNKKYAYNWALDDIEVVNDN